MSGGAASRLRPALLLTMGGLRTPPLSNEEHFPPSGLLPEVRSRMGKGRTCRTDIKLFTVTNSPLPPAPLLWLIPSYSPFKEGSFSISSSEKPALTTPTLRSGVIVHLPLQAPSLHVITGCVHVSFAHRSSSCPGRDLSYASLCPSIQHRTGSTDAHSPGSAWARWSPPARSALSSRALGTGGDRLPSWMIRGTRKPSRAAHQQLPASS